LTRRSQRIPTELDTSVERFDASQTVRAQAGLNDGLGTG
jgi:hypothetical protein